MKKKIVVFGGSGFLGCSTGLFSILLAYYENPYAKIIVSGIGIKTGGKTYYKPNNGKENRCKVDQKLFSQINKKIKNNLITTDKEMANYCNILLWKGEKF